eukprot:symbB.v1.2.001554.t2/scaffold70.1/size352959/4
MAFRHRSHFQLMSAKIRQQMLQDGKEPAFMRDKANEMKFWKTVFDRYDTDNSGALDFDEITEVVRSDLKIAERTLTKVELRDFYSHLDENDDQVVDWHEWLSFVSQGKLRDTRPIDQVLSEVGRAVRTALRRLGLRPNQVEDRIKALPEATDAIDQFAFFRLFRKGLQINRQDCSDDNLKRTFASIADGAVYLRLQSILDFLQVSCLAKTNKEIGMGITFPGLVGGMRGSLLGDLGKNDDKRRRFWRSGPTAGPFALNGRRLPPCSRLAVDMRPHERQRQPLRPSVSCPDLQNNPAMDMTACHLSEKTLAALEAATKEDDPPPAPPTSPVSPHPPSRGLDRGKFASNNSRASNLREASPVEQERPVSAGSPAFGKAFEAAMDAAKDAKDRATSDPFAIFLKMNAQAENQRKPAPKKPAQRQRQAPATESYRVIIGKDALNRVEQQLLDAGVDMRGAYHRTGMLRIEDASAGTRSFGTTTWTLRLVEDMLGLQFFAMQFAFALAQYRGSTGHKCSTLFLANHGTLGTPNHRRVGSFCLCCSSSLCASRRGCPQPSPACFRRRRGHCGRRVIGIASRRSG